MSEIPDEIVPRYYVMNPKTEVVLCTATDLEPGMVVLLASPLGKINPDKLNRLKFQPTSDSVGDEERQAEIKYNLNVHNRWCQIGHIDLYTYANISFVGFVGTYADGTQHKRQVNETEAWIVKKDSIPESLNTIDSFVVSTIQTGDMYKITVVDD